MRWKAIYLILGLLALLGIFSFFFLDNFIGWSIERSLETVLGAKVNVDHLRLDFVKLKITINKLQITNPRNTWRNLIETNNISFQMAWEPLFSGKIVIEEIGVEDLMINTTRKTDGKLKKFILPGPFGQAQRKLNNDIAAIPAINPESLQNQVSIDKLFTSYQLKTDFSTIEVHNQIETSNLKWQSNLKKLDEVKAKVAVIQKRFQDFQANQPKSLIELKSKLESLQELQKSGHDVQTEIRSTTKGFSEEFSGLKTEILNLKDAADDDFRALLKLAKLPDFQSVNMAEVLFGKAILTESSFLIDIVDNLQKQIPVKIVNPPKEKHPRGGQDIIFPGRKTYPRLLIKHISISTKGTPASIFDGYYMKGVVTGITSEPQLYGLPTILKVNGNTPEKAFLDLNGSLNHLTPAIDDRFTLTLGDLPLPDINFPQSSLLPKKISSGSALILSKVNIQPNYFLLDLTLEGRNMVCDYSANPVSNDLFQEIVKETLAGIDNVSIHYRLEGIAKKLKMQISSNIDQLVTDRLKAVIGAKIAQATQEIRNRLNNLLLNKQRELETIRAKYESELETSINQVQELLNNERQKIDTAKKALEDKVKQEQEKTQQAQDNTKKELQNKIQTEQDKAKKELENKLRQQLPKFP